MKHLIQYASLLFASCTVSISETSTTQVENAMSVEAIRERDSIRNEMRMQDSIRKVQSKLKAIQYVQDIIKKKGLTNIVGTWRLDLGKGYNDVHFGYDNLILYYSDSNNSFMLYSKSEVEMNNAVNITPVSEGWKITLKKNWSDYYILGPDGKITMISEGYDETSANCLQYFNKELLD